MSDLTKTMKNETRAYGIEIEFLRPTSVTMAHVALELTQAGTQTRVEHYNHQTRTHWKLVVDSSVQSHIPTHVGRNELVSPKLYGLEGLRQIETVCKVLKELGCKVNRTCGLHVHHDASDFQSNTLKKLYQIYKRAESELDKMVAPSRRWNMYCGSLRHTTFRDPQHNRFHKLNLTNYINRGSIEVRHHAGTIEAEKIIAWLHITQAIVERAVAGRIIKDVDNTDALLRGLGMYCASQVQDHDALRDVYKEVRKYVRKRVAKLSPAAAQAAA